MLAGHASYHREWLKNMKTTIEEQVSLDSSLEGLQSDDLNKFYKSFLPEFYSLKNYKYSIFGCIDFVSPYVRDPKHCSRRTSHFQRLLKQVIQQNKGLHRRDFQYFLTDEWSGSNEKHLHFIIRKTPRVEANIEAILYSFNDIWLNKIHGGLCKIVKFDQSLNGVAYVCKRQKDGNGVELEKNCQISKGFLEHIKKRIRLEESVYLLKQPSNLSGFS